MKSSGKALWGLCPAAHVKFELRASAISAADSEPFVKSVEGATRDGGKGPSIWDTFCKKYSEKIADRRGGDPGAGSYYRYKEDVQLVADIGLNAYRFSISWPRIFPSITIY